MTPKNETSRRLFLAAGTASTVFCALSTAAAGERETDPIFAAIERHKAAFDHLEAVAFNSDKATVERAIDDEEDALEELVETPFESRAGARAAVEWLVRYARGGGEFDAGSILAALLDSPALAD